jgi:hypothetical protein
VPWRRQNNNEGGSMIFKRGKNAETASICESFGYDAYIVQRGEKIAALPVIAALGKNTTGEPI